MLGALIQHITLSLRLGVQYCTVLYTLYSSGLLSLYTLNYYDITMSLCDQISQTLVTQQSGSTTTTINDKYCTV